MRGEVSVRVMFVCLCRRGEWHISYMLKESGRCVRAVLEAIYEAERVRKTT